MLDLDHLPTGELNEALAQLLRQVFGAQAAVRSAQVVNRKTDYRVLIVQLHHPDWTVVVKLAGPGAAVYYDFSRTAAFFRLVSTHTDIPMPEIYALDVSAQRMPWQYMVRQYLSGEEWAQIRAALSPREQAEAYTQIGRAVAQLHAIHFERFGELNPAGEVTGTPSLLKALRARAAAFIRDPELVDFFLTVLERVTDLFTDVSQPELCHEDLHGHNILFTRRKGRLRLATLLDFDKAWAGHGESDLARLSLWTGMTAEPFWAAYQAIHPLDSLWPRRRPIYQLLWCLEYAVPSERHRADTRAVCAELGVQMPKDF